MDTPIGAETVSKFTLIAQTRGIDNAVRELNQIQQAINFDSTRAVRALQGFDHHLAKASKHGAKTFSAMTENIGMTIRALRENQSVGIATVRGLKNLEKGTSSYQTKALGLLKTHEKLRVFTHNLGVGMTDLGVRIQDLGKKAQWTGRQMMVGLSVPIAGGALIAVKSWNRLNQEVTRVQKVMSDSDFKNIGGAEGVLKIARKLGHEYGVVDEMVTALMGDFAAMGYVSKKSLSTITELTLRISQLGEIDISDASDAVRSISKGFNQTLQETSQTLDTFNAIENTTAINLRELVPAFPEVANAAAQFGLKADETAQALAAMRENAIPVSESAHALKFALTSLVKPTKQTADQIEELQNNLPEVGNVFANISTGALRGRPALIAMAQAWLKLQEVRGPAYASQFLSGIVGKRQVSRILALFDAILDGEEELRDQSKSVLSDYTTDWARSTAVLGQAVDNEKRRRRELRAIRESDQFKYQQAMRDFKSNVAKIGQELSPLFADAIGKISDVISKMMNVLERNPALQKFAIAALATLATIGPLVYVVSQLGVAFGTVTRGLGKLIPSLGYATKEMALAAIASGKAARRYIVFGDSVWDTFGPMRQFVARMKEMVKVLFSGESASKAIKAARSIETGVIQAETVAVDLNTAALTRNTVAKVQNASVMSRGLVGLASSEMDDVLAEAGDVIDRRRAQRLRTPGFFTKKSANSWMHHLGEYGPGALHGPFPQSATQGLLGAVRPSEYDDIMAGIMEVGPRMAEQAPKISKFKNAFSMLPRAFGAANGGMQKFIGLFSNMFALVGRAIPVTSKFGAVFAKIFGATGLATSGAGASGSGAIGALASNPVGWIAAIAIALVAAMPLFAKLSGHWDSFWKGVTKTWKVAVGIFKSAWDDLKAVFDSLLRSLHSIIDPITEGFNSIADAMGGGGKGSKKSGWQKMGVYWSSIAVVIAAIAKTLTIILRVLALIVELVAKIAGFLMKWLIIKPLVKTIEGLITGFRLMGQAVGWVGDRLKGVANVAGDVANKVGSIAGDVGGFLGIGGGGDEEKIKKLGFYIRQAVKESEKFGQWWSVKYAMTFNKAVSENKLGVAISQWRKMGKIAREQWNQMPEELKKKTTFREFRIKIALEGGYNVGEFLAKRSAANFKRKFEKWMAKAPPQFIPVTNPEEASKAAVEWRQAFNNALRDQINELKEQAMSSFEAMASARLRVFDDQIKAIEAQEKAEEELYETQKYLAERKKALDAFALTGENYRRDRALAIYEGRYDDARSLDLQYQADTKEHQSELTNMDDERNKVLLQKERDAQKERIEIQKQAMAEQLDLQKKALQDQLDEITKWTPRNQQAMIDMVNAMNGALAGYGAMSMGPAMEIATSSWGIAVGEAAKQIAEDAYLAGQDIVEAAAQGMELNPDWVSYFSEENKPKWLKRRDAAQQRYNELRFINAGAWQEFYKRGGSIFHSGGQVGSGSPKDVPAVLQTGEYVVQRDAVKRLGTNFLDSINRYHRGGEVIGSTFGNMMSDMMYGNILGFLAGKAKFGRMTKEEVLARYAPKRIIGGGTGSAMPRGLVMVSPGGGYMIDWLQQLLAQAFPDLTANIMGGSKFRPGSAGYHGTGQALDIGDMGWASARLMDLFNYLANKIAEFDIVELIHQNKIFHPWDGWQHYGPMDHYDHVHVAVGSWKEGLVPLMKGGKVLVDNLPALLHKGEVVLPANIAKNMEAGGGGGDTYIMVDTFIGQRSWFESMMEEYNWKSTRHKQHRRGTINRTVRTRKDNSVRYV